MPQIINIVGTDTGIGKTYTCVKILEYLIKSGFKATALKPVATGLIDSKYGCINEDVKYLKEASNLELAVTQINPICFKKPISPNIAAAHVGFDLRVSSIINLISPTIRNLNCDYILVEGVGGIMVPLNNNETYLDFLNEFNSPTILVVGIKLGCLNQSLLSFNALIANNINCIGWIANFVDPLMLESGANLQFLATKLPIPLLATINYEEDLTITSFGIDYFR